jgi:hypothetical protein
MFSRVINISTTMVVIGVHASLLACTTFTSMPMYSIPLTMVNDVHCRVCAHNAHTNGMDPEHFIFVFTAYHMALIVCEMNTCQPNSSCQINWDPVFEVNFKWSSVHAFEIRTALTVL